MPERPVPVAAAPKPHRHNVVQGLARAQLGDGRVASCAGDHATLLPANRLTRARLNRIYGDGRLASFATAPRLPRDPRAERGAVRAPCGPDGWFRAVVPDGTWFVVAPLRAPGQGATEGVSAREEIAVHGGETMGINLTE